MPTITVPGTPPAGGGRGGGGARTDDENIQRQIDRYKALEAAATKTYGVIEANRSKNIEDLQREIRVETTTQEIAAKLGAKYADASAAQKQALQDAVRAYETAKDANQQYLKSLQDADATNRKYGDGAASLAKIQHDLNQQLKTGQLNATAYGRALKEQTENAHQAALAAQRYDDNIGSIGAGFEHAANAYARANDLFSVGEKAFTGLTDAMGQGLDVLLGKSNKTFGEIAADFANMLAKMAIQAAASQIFKTIFGTAASAGVGAASASGATIAATGGFMQHGGPVSAGTPYVVGEAGPELFVPAAAGRIVPNNQMGGGGNITVNVAMGQTQGTSDPSAALAFGRKIKAAVADVIANEKRPGGSLYVRMS
jgi:hypothetical protein